MNKKSNVFLGIRHIQYLLMFSAVASCYAVRTILSVSIIAMTAKNPRNPDIPTYPEWQNTTDEILSSFFWGYVLPQIISGKLVTYYGPKWFLFAAMIASALFNVLVPLISATYGSTGLIVLRVLQGTAQGFFYPSIHSLLSKWAPESERSKAVSFVYGASMFGIVTSMLITGAICDSNTGWPGVFYLYAGLGVLWALCWAVLGADAPSQHRLISKDEVDFIEQSCIANNFDSKQVPTPWMSIITSLPVWAILFAGTGQLWGTFTLLTEIPTYMNNIMKYDISKNSQLSTLPYVVGWLMALLIAPFADMIISKDYFKLTNIRKSFMFMATAFPGSALVWLGLLDESQKSLAITLLVVAVSFTSFQHCSCGVNHIDLAPNHAGVLLGLCNGISNIGSIVATSIISLFGKDKTDPILWRKVFWLSAGIYFGTCIFYTLFASAELQEWNAPKPTKNEKKSEKNVV